MKWNIENEENKYKIEEIKSYLEEIGNSLEKQTNKSLKYSYNISIDGFTFYICYGYGEKKYKFLNIKINETEIINIIVYYYNTTVYKSINIKNFKKIIDKILISKETGNLLSHLLTIKAFYQQA